MAPPQSIEATTTIPRKSHSRYPTCEPKIEETPGTYSSESGFPCDYIPPRKDDTPPVTLQKNPYYMLVTPYIPYEIIIDEDMLGKVPQLKYEYHDITDLVEVPWN
jgi:hypothetical protein